MVLLQVTPLLEVGFSLPLILESNSDEKPHPPMLLIVSHRRVDSQRRVTRPSPTPGGSGGGFCSSAAAVDVAPAPSSSLTRQPKPAKSQTKSLSENNLSSSYSSSTAVVNIDKSASSIPLTIWFLRLDNSSTEPERCLVQNKFGEDDGESTWWYDLRQCTGCQQFLVRDDSKVVTCTSSKPGSYAQPKPIQKVRLGSLADAIRDAVEVAKPSSFRTVEVDVGAELGQDVRTKSSTYKSKGKSFWRLKRFHSIRLVTCPDCTSGGPPSEEGTPHRGDFERGDNWSSTGLSSLPSTRSSIELPHPTPLSLVTHASEMTPPDRIVRGGSAHIRIHPTAAEEATTHRPSPSLFQAARKVSIVLLVEFDAEFILAARKVLTKNGALGIVHPTTQQAIKYLQDPNRIPIAGILCPFILKASGINATEFVDVIHRTTSCRLASSFGHHPGPKTAGELDRILARDTFSPKLIAFGGPHYSSCALKGGCTNYFKYPPFSATDLEAALSELGVKKQR